MYVVPTFDWHDALQNAYSLTHLKEIAGDSIDIIINWQHADALAVLHVGSREHLHNITSDTTRCFLSSLTASSTIRRMAPKPGGIAAAPSSVHRLRP
jgi:hypothetical protein